MDEFWSFVQNKKNQRWTWYAIERNSGIILAWHNGKRRDEDFLVLWLMLLSFAMGHPKIIFSLASELPYCIVRSGGYPFVEFLFCSVEFSVIYMLIDTLFL